MYLSHLTLSEFRNYRQLDLTLEPGLYLFHGENAQGKTNLLEAVSMLSTGTSFHATTDREVVNWEAPARVARLEGTVIRKDDELQLEFVLFDPTPPDVPSATRVVRGMELPANTPRKRIKINDIPRRTMDLIGQLKVVLFAPTDLHLVDGPPDERRRFLDRALCQISPHYCQDLVKYRKIVLQRSAMLKRIRDYQEDPRLLDYLDDQLATLASHICTKRQQMVESLNGEANSFQSAISGGREQLCIVYRPSFTMHKTNEQDEEHARDEQGEQKQHYLHQLRDVRRKEIQQGVCLLGPHRDDLEFVVNGINMLTYGSRGQQRTAALATKLSELAYMRSTTGDEPVLLLDDVFSELDAHRRSYLLQQVLTHQQVLLTATDVNEFPKEMMEQAHVYRVMGGEIEQA
ncbi:MAG TPA: DNA replication and repair protein RecF [Ktedonobacter sp.]|nr:DNA replication and repair protein RecF [Ktedonobacter sp.]